jgi:hypothetical protein|tara:strand:- start:2509 stop:3222 length:714 start_codon:yes stop_codon:yes gene_type:complete
MDTYLQIIQGVQSDLTIGDESPLFPLATVKLAIGRAYRKGAGLFRWPDLEDARVTSTKDGDEYYESPDDFQRDSIWRIEVDSKQYGEDPDGSPMSYPDYLIWRADDDNANSTEKKWAVHKNRFFIFPVPTTDGDKNISVWGQRLADALSNDGDVTIWSYTMPECNEAVVLEAVAILKAKGEAQQSGQILSLEAKQIWVTAWNRIKLNQSKYEKTQPFFNVKDMFGKPKTSDIIGNFK